MRIPTDDLVLELMAARSGTTYLAREIGYMLRDIYDRGASSKSISKTLILLDEDYPLMSRRETTNKEKSLYNCRYIYLWGQFSTDGAVA